MARRPFFNSLNFISLNRPSSDVNPSLVWRSKGSNPRSPAAPCPFLKRVTVSMAAMAVMICHTASGLSAISLVTAPVE